MAAASEDTGSDEDVPSVEQLLTCSVCQHMVSDPRFLPCWHSVCLTCVDSLRDASDQCSGSCRVCLQKLQLPADSSQLKRDVSKLQLARTVKIASKLFKSNDSEEDRGAVPSLQLCSSQGCQNQWKDVSVYSNQAMCEQHLRVEQDKLSAEIASLREPVADALSPASRLAAGLVEAANKKQSVEATLQEVESKFGGLRELLEDAETLATKAVRIDIERCSSCIESFESVRAKLEQFQSRFESDASESENGRSAVQLVEETRRALRQLEHLDTSFATVSDEVKSAAEKSTDVFRTELERLGSKMEVLVDKTVSCLSVLSVVDTRPVVHLIEPKFVTCLTNTNLMLDSNSRAVPVPSDGKVPPMSVKISDSILVFMFQNGDTADAEMQFFSFPYCDVIFGAMYKIQFPVEKGPHASNIMVINCRPYVIKGFFGVSSRCYFIVAHSACLWIISASGEFVKFVKTKPSNLCSFCSASEQLVTYSRGNGIFIYTNDLQLTRFLPLSALACSAIFAISTRYILADLGDKEVSLIDPNIRAVTKLAQLKEFNHIFSRFQMLSDAGGNAYILIEGSHIFTFNSQGDVLEIVKLRRAVLLDSFTKVCIENKEYILVYSTSNKSIELLSINSQK